ncbi:unnamed protein product [Choristocarpus tenellus]
MLPLSYCCKTKTSKAAQEFSHLQTQHRVNGVSLTPGVSPVTSSVFGKAVKRTNSWSWLNLRGAMNTTAVSRGRSCSRQLDSNARGTTCATESHCEVGGEVCEGGAIAGVVRADDHVLPCPCLGSYRHIGQGQSRVRGPLLSSIWYGLLVSAREALPLWAYIDISRGGLGASPQATGLSMALGMFLTACVYAFSRHQFVHPVVDMDRREEGTRGGPRAVSDAHTLCAGRGGVWRHNVVPMVWGHGVIVGILGVLALLMVNGDSGEVGGGESVNSSPLWRSAALWLGMAIIVTVNQLGLMFAQAMQHSSYRCHGHNSSGIEGSDPLWMYCRSVLAGDAIGGASGLLVVAASLGTMWTFPVNGSFWLLGCFLGDVGMALWTRSVSDLDNGLRLLPNGNDELQHEMVSGDGREGIEGIVQLV